jgi:cyclopropane fatty-acyl-phospholipid synthase-like methyltransferase
MKEEKRRPTDSASWDKRYVEGELPWDSDKPDVHLAGAIAAHSIKPGKALEIGCGTGTNSIWLAQHGFEVTGMDISQTAIAKAKEKASAAGVNCHLHVGDFMVEQVPGAPFDFVYDRGCLHVFQGHEELSRFASRVGAVLASEGMWHSLIGSTDGPPRDTGPPRHSATEIVAAVEPHFEILELRSTTFDNESHRHVRAWVLVARRRVFHPA